MHLSDTATELSPLKVWQMQGMQNLIGFSYLFDYFLLMSSSFIVWKFKWSKEATYRGHDNVDIVVDLSTLASRCWHFDIDTLMSASFPDVFQIWVFRRPRGLFQLTPQMLSTFLHRSARTSHSWPGQTIVTSPCRGHLIGLNVRMLCQQNCFDTEMMNSL